MPRKDDEHDLTEEQYRDLTGRIDAVIGRLESERHVDDECVAWMKTVSRGVYAMIAHVREAHAGTEHMRRQLSVEAEKHLAALENEDELRVVMSAIGSGKLTRDQEIAIARQCSNPRKERR